MPPCSKRFLVEDYALDATLNSGQAFRWHREGSAWSGVIQGHCVRLSQVKYSFVSQSPYLLYVWSWIKFYLQLKFDLPAVLASFPEDGPMQAAVKACRGLRLLRQDPWECLASFILSSTKQIV